MLKAAPAARAAGREALTNLICCAVIIRFFNLFNNRAIIVIVASRLPRSFADAFEADLFDHRPQFRARREDDLRLADHACLKILFCNRSRTADREAEIPQPAQLLAVDRSAISSQIESKSILPLTGAEA